MTGGAGAPTAGRTIQTLQVGLYADLLYRRDGETLTTDRAFVQFALGLAPRVGELVVFGRVDPEPGRTHYALPADGVRFVPLPHYGRTSDVAGVARSLGRAARIFRGELRELDAVWLFGPHPVAIVFALLARRAHVPVVLGVRQDFPRYVRRRLPGRAWRVAMPAAHTLEAIYRLLALRVPAVVVGDELARRYAGGAPVLSAGFSLIRDGDLVPVEHACARRWDPPLRLLSVGRLDAEKNPLLLPQILGELRADGTDWRLDVVGTGPLAASVERRAAELGVADALRLLGYVRNGTELWRLYRESHAFLHVSFTEGLPQVLFEAQAAGLPIVATDVGSVRAALDDGAAGLLVPPGRADLPVAALRRLRDEPDLRQRLVEAALRSVAASTMDAQLDRIADFVRASARASR